jgi:hypothetical protein
MDAATIANTTYLLSSLRNDMAHATTWHLLLLEEIRYIGTAVEKLGDCEIDD